jgi:choline transport protein
MSVRNLELKDSANGAMQVDKKKHIPTNAIWLSLTISCLLNLIILGSAAAFNALISLQVVALMATYMISISCILWRRIKHPDTLPRCRYSLGKAGITVNVISLIYAAFAFFWCFWPQATPVELDTVNWAPVMFSGVMVIAMALFFVRGRKVYQGPVVTVEGYRSDMARRTEGILTKDEINAVEAETRVD